MIGKIAGGIIGFLVGGPLGAAGGAAIGAAIDGDFNGNDVSNPNQQNEYKSQTIIFKPNGQSEISPIPNSPVNNESIEVVRCRLAGVTFDNRQQLIAKVINGADVYLVREPNNQYDVNAIAVLNSSYQILGYIPKDVAARVAYKIPIGRYLKGAVVNKHGGNGLSYGLEIEAQIAIVNTSTNQIINQTSYQHLNGASSYANDDSQDMSEYVDRTIYDNRKPAHDYHAAEMDYEIDDPVADVMREYREDYYEYRNDYDAYTSDYN